MSFFSFVFRAVYGFFAALGIIGYVLYLLLILAAFFGWFANIYKLWVHLPLMDLWTLARLIALAVPFGGLLGWF